MNFFLSINRKYILFLCIFVIIGLLIFIFFRNQLFFETTIETKLLKISNADVTKPKFAINRKNKKIFITANQGNFLNKDEILLKNNVKFRSDDFSIETTEVVFDRKNQTAISKNKSYFKANNTTIISEGFDIYDNGNRINFYGKAILKLK